MTTYQYFKCEYRWFRWNYGPVGAFCKAIASTIKPLPF
jgi:hypothetical protein